MPMIVGSVVASILALGIVALLALFVVFRRRRARQVPSFMVTPRTQYPFSFAETNFTSSFGGDARSEYDSEKDYPQIAAAAEESRQNPFSDIHSVPTLHFMVQTDRQTELDQQIRELESRLSYHLQVHSDPSVVAEVRRKIEQLIDVRQSDWAVDQDNDGPTDMV
jgi:hypothetical protein